MIKFKNVSAGYDGVPVLKNIDFVIPKNQIVCIVGKNGCGKSTLLNCLARQIKISCGEITLQNQNISNYKPKEFSKMISFLVQSRNVPSIDVETLVLHGRFPYLPFPRKVSKNDIEIAENAMKTVGVFDLRFKNLTALSGGERQKVYIAMILAQDTPIVLLDEPTTYLDINHQFDILELILKLKKSGKTVIAVMHDLSQALQIADSVCVMKDGDILEVNSSENIASSNVLETAFDVKCNMITDDNNKKYYIFTKKNYK